MSLLSPHITPCMEKACRYPPLVDNAVNDDGQDKDKHDNPKTDGNQLLALKGTMSLINEEHAAEATV